MTREHSLAKMGNTCCKLSKRQQHSTKHARSMPCTQLSPACMHAHPKLKNHTPDLHTDIWTHLARRSWRLFCESWSRDTRSPSRPCTGLGSSRPLGAPVGGRVGLRVEVSYRVGVRARIELRVRIGSSQPLGTPVGGSVGLGVEIGVEARVDVSLR